jgi:hypothetical protein
MAHFAKISEQNEVIHVVTFNDKDMLDSSNQPSESIGQKYLEKNNHWPSHLWIQCSYNTFQGKHVRGGTPLRGNFPGIGYIWDTENKIFIKQKPYPSWIKNVQEARWQSPIGDAPTLVFEDSLQKTYIWNEENQVWDLIDYTS